ncbi:SBF-like CPA transporter family-domain-containing protein [Lipomyces oligophaga]|uniref:SBF-like CPA transporter family-domain-containing protein n=1 Tax=Lipomyces oligophaga TaxID=45792 RepID=UPI0034CEF193
MTIKNSLVATKRFFKTLTVMDVVHFALDQWFLICLGIGILIAYLVPNLGRKGGWIAAQYSIVYVCPAIIFFISGLTMDTKTLGKNLLVPKLHVVAQGLSYLYTSAIWFALAYAALQSNNPHINDQILAGLVLLGCTPTTIGSNVVFTRSAHGNASATLIEVVIANCLSPVLSPALVSMYMTSSSKWGQYRPATSSEQYATLYRSVFKQLGLTVFVPLFVGQVLRNIFKNFVVKYAAKFKINKAASICLVLILWSSFSSCFYSGAFKLMTPQTTALVMLQNLGLYFFYLGTTLVVTRWSHKIRFQNKHLDRVVDFFRFNKRDTIAICYIVPAKTPALGVPLITALYANNNGLSTRDKEMMQIPMILYQIEQLVISSSSIPFFRRWVADEEQAEEQRKLDAEQSALAEAAEQGQAHDQSIDRDSLTEESGSTDGGSQAENPESLEKLVVSEVLHGEKNIKTG